jgi:hypothetical protein
VALGAVGTPQYRWENEWADTTLARQNWARRSWRITYWTAVGMGDIERFRWKARHNIRQYDDLHDRSFLRAYLDSELARVRGNMKW